jgi:hypothetical protein
MPIKPENKHRYPADWPATRERILARAGYRCEHPGCVAMHYGIGQWLRFEGSDVWVFKQVARGESYLDARQRAAELWWDSGMDGTKPIVIVLTIAHLDHQPENCADENLRAWCQRHHLAYDHDHHRANSQATRRARAGTLELF